ncbi:MAG: thiamine pyrophosphate-dependent enzyme [Pseudomonadota bacterium]
MPDLQSFESDAQGLLLRRPLVAGVLAERGDALVVTGLGSATYDAAAAGDDDANFYYWGGMGLTAMTGLGVAIAQPDRRVLVITGDGDMMMGVGSFATIATRAPVNLAILVLDNEQFGETGEQAGLSGGKASLSEMARGAGFENAMTVDGSADPAEMMQLLYETPGPALCVAKVAKGNEERVLPSLDGAYLARRFRENLGYQKP